MGGPAARQTRRESRPKRKVEKRPAARPAARHIERGFPERDEAHSLNLTLMNTLIRERRLGINYLSEYIKKPERETLKVKIIKLFKNLWNADYWYGHFVALDKMIWCPRASLVNALSEGKVNLQAVLRDEERNLGKLTEQLRMLVKERKIKDKKGEWVNFDVWYFGRLDDMLRGSTGELKSNIVAYLEDLERKGKGRK